MYPFCSEICLLVSNICWNFIIFENWRKFYSDVATPGLFSSGHISLLLLSYNWEAFQNSFFIWKYIFGSKIINIFLTILTGLSNQQSSGCILISNHIYF